MQSDDRGLVERLRYGVRYMPKLALEGSKEAADFRALGDSILANEGDVHLANLTMSQAAAAIERLVAERDEARRQFWLELREPGCVPERKGPWPHHLTAMTLREFMRERPEAFITVISFVDGGLLLQDGPECLQMLDGRSMGTGRKHIKSSNAARARQALGDT